MLRAALLGLLGLDRRSIAFMEIPSKFFEIQQTKAPTASDPEAYYAIYFVVYGGRVRIGDGEYTYEGCQFIIVQMKILLARFLAEITSPTEERP